MPRKTPSAFTLAKKTEIIKDESPRSIRRRNLLDKKAKLQERKDKAKQAREAAYGQVRMSSKEGRFSTISDIGTKSSSTLDLNTN